ncbi:MAG: hypothetical protein WAM73_19195, partial [Desulfobacterales bacterium]
MNTLRGIITLTMVSFLVAGAGICDREALALATPAVVRKKIQIPPEHRFDAPGAVVGTPAPKADTAPGKPEPTARPMPAEAPAARLRAKSDAAVTPPGKMHPAVAAHPSPPEPAEAPVAAVTTT